MVSDMKPDISILSIFIILIAALFVFPADQSWPSLSRATEPFLENLAEILIAFGAAIALMRTSLTLPDTLNRVFDRLTLSFKVGNVTFGINRDRAEGLLSDYADEIESFRNSTNFLVDKERKLTDTTKKRLEAFLEPSDTENRDILGKKLLDYANAATGDDKFVYDIAENIFQRKLFFEILRYYQTSTKLDDAIKRVCKSENYKRHGFWHSQFRVLRGVNLIRLVTRDSYGKELLDTPDINLGWVAGASTQVTDVVLDYFNQNPKTKVDLMAGMPDVEPQHFFRPRKPAKRKWWQLNSDWKN